MRDNYAKRIKIWNSEDKEVQLIFLSEQYDIEDGKEQEKLF
jgi:hypothetical protein